MEETENFEETEEVEEIEIEFNRFVIPANTRFEERTIVTENDIIVGAGCRLGYGLIGRKIVVGERVTVDGNITGEEVRLDAWDTINGDVVSKRDAFIGEFTTINGRLTVFGDLEIGRNVRIKGGFEAKGLITIQDPLPVLMFLFFYILELLRLGKLEEVEKLLVTEEFLSPLIIPENSTVNLEIIETNRDFEAVGSRILGNVRAGNVRAEGCEIFGSIKGKDIVLDGCRVHGAIEGREIYLLNGSEVFGSLNGDKIFMEDNCTVEASIIGRKGVWIRSQIELPERLSFKSEFEVGEEKKESEEIKVIAPDEELQEELQEGVEKKDSEAEGTENTTEEVSETPEEQIKINSNKKESEKSVEGKTKTKKSGKSKGRKSKRKGRK
jgi:predicted acyltransferase (DUF342 family)